MRYINILKKQLGIMGKKRKSRYDPMSINNQKYQNSTNKQNSTTQILGGNYWRNEAQKNYQELTQSS